VLAAIETHTVIHQRSPPRRAAPLVTGSSPPGIGTQCVLMNETGAVDAGETTLSGDALLDVTRSIGFLPGRATR
jgi:hypothetical protein